VRSSGSSVDFAPRLRKSLPYLVYLQLTQRDSGKLYDYFFDLWPEFFRLVPGRMDDLFLNFGLWLKGDDVCPMQRFHLYVLERAGVVPGDRILDVGSGLGGQDLLCYREHGPLEIIGLEPSARHVEFCNRRARELGLDHAIRYVQGCAERLPASVREQTFDKILALNCLYHLERRSDFFRAACGCLKERGSLIVVDQYLTRMPREPMERKAVEFDRRYFKARQPYYTQDQFHAELREAGLEVAASESVIGRMLPPFYEFLRERRSELRALCRRLGYPTLLLDIALKGAELMKLATESGLYESAIVEARRACVVPAPA
jgi:microcystin synthetase protein McyJ